MDDETRMNDAGSNPRPFRLQRRRKLRWFVAFVVLAIIVKATGDRVAPPLPHGIRSGEHQVLRVHQNASLTVAVQTPAQEYQIGWLGIELTQPKRAAKWLETKFSHQSRIEIRFDRRRLDASGNLVAYLFQDEVLLNATLIEQGLAIEATHPSDHAPIARRIRQAKAELPGLPNVVRE